MTATPKKPAAKAGTAAKPVAKKPAALPPPADVTVGRSVGATIIGLIFTGALCAFVFGNQRSDVMLAVSHEARGVTSLQSSSTPNTSSEALLNWTKLAISEVFTYNFNDIGPRIMGAQRFFTPEGWTGFLLAMGEQQILAQVESQRQFVSTIPGANTVVTSEGQVGDTYYWTVQMNTVTSVYTGATSVKNGAMTLKIARIPTRDSDAGYPFGIVQIIQ